MSKYEKWFIILSLGERNALNLIYVGTYLISTKKK